MPFSAYRRRSAARRRGRAHRRGRRAAARGLAPVRIPRRHKAAMVGPHLSAQASGRHDRHAPTGAHARHLHQPFQPRPEDRRRHQGVADAGSASSRSSSISTRTAASAPARTGNGGSTRNSARCHAVILVLTPNWLASTWCRIELAQARALGKVILPVMCAPLGERYVLPEVQAVDLIDWNAGGLERLEQRLNAITSELARGFRLHPDRSPYPGIHAFEAEDAAIYFGRDDETRARDRAARRAPHARAARGCCVIIGASGSGKSSLLRAGVLPQIARRRREWMALPPIRPEKAPLETVAKAIAEHLGKPEDWRNWHERLRQPGRDRRHRRAAQGSAHRRGRATPPCCCRSTSSRRCSPSRPRPSARPSCSCSRPRSIRRAICRCMVVATGRSDVLEGLDRGRRSRATDRDLSAAADAARSRAAAGRGAGRGRRHQRREGLAGAHRPRRRERRGAAAARAHAVAAVSPRRRRQEAHARRIRGARRSAARPQSDPELGAAGRRPGDRRPAADAERSSRRCATPSCRTWCASGWRTASACARPARMSELPRGVAASRPRAGRRRGS